MHTRPAPPAAAAPLLGGCAELCSAR